MINLLLVGALQWFFKMANLCQRVNVSSHSSPCLYAETFFLKLLFNEFNNLYFNRQRPSLKILCCGCKIPCILFIHARCKDDMFVTYKTLISCCFLHWIQSVNPHFFVTLYYNGSSYICDSWVGYSAGGYSLSPRWLLTWHSYPFFRTSCTDECWYCTKPMITGL